MQIKLEDFICFIVSGEKRFSYQPIPAIHQSIFKTGSGAFEKIGIFS